MACLGIRCGGAGDGILRKHSGGLLDDRSGQISGFNKLHSLSIPNLAAKLPHRRISTAVNASLTCVADHPSAFFDLPARFVSQDDNECNDHTTIESPRVSDKLDEWVRNSLAEIVRNVKQAPLLVQIYADGEVKTEKAVGARDWPNVIRDRSSTPEGIILVEELRENSDPSDSSDRFEKEDGARAFGVLIQGKVRDQCKSACYLLKTSSVNGGLGLFCTHFCLMKVQSFGTSAFSQFNDCWLLP